MIPRCALPPSPFLEYCAAEVCRAHYWRVTSLRGYLGHLAEARPSF